MCLLVQPGAALHSAIIQLPSTHQQTWSVVANIQFSHHKLSETEFALRNASPATFWSERHVLCSSLYHHSHLPLVQTSKVAELSSKSETLPYHVTRQANLIMFIDTVKKEIHLV